MIKASELIGKPIVSTDNGAVLGNVHEFGVDTAQQKIIALVIAGEGLFSKGKAVRAESVGNVSDNVTVPSSQAVISIEQIPNLKALLEQHIKLHNLLVVTQSGHRVGHIEDYAVDSTTLEIKEYYLSGIVSMLKHEKITYDRVVSIGKDVLIVQD